MKRPDVSSALRPAAREILRARLHSVTRLVKDVSAGCIRKPEYIHQLRVAIRRAEAAISAFESELRPGAVSRARRRLRAVRKAAGAVRDCDVHATLLKSNEVLQSEEQRPVLKYLKRRLKLLRSEAADEVIAISRRKRCRKLKKASQRLLRLTKVAAAEPSAQTLLGAAVQTITCVAADTRAAADADLTSLESLHALRVSAKQVRYAVEIFRACMPEPLSDSVLAHLRDFQAVLGRVNDARQMSSWLAAEANFLFNAARPRSIPKGSTPESIHEELRVIVGRLDADLALAHERALPQVAPALEAALRPLEEWAHPAPGREPAPVRTGAPGRHAEGGVEPQAPNFRRLTIAAS